MYSANDDCERYRSIMLGDDLGNLRETVPLLNHHQEQCIPCMVWMQTDFRDLPTRVIPRPGRVDEAQLDPSDRISIYIRDLSRAAQAMVKRQWSDLKIASSTASFNPSS